MKREDGAMGTLEAALMTTTAELERFRGRLAAERQAACARLERKLFEARAFGDGQSGDDADRASHSTETGRLFGAARRERALIREIDRAMDKLARGEFGLCEGSGEPIEERRLEAWPWTRYSRAFLEQDEQERRAATA